MTTVIIIKGKLSEDTEQKTQEYLNYMASIEDVEIVESNIGGGGFINTKPIK